MRSAIPLLDKLVALPSLSVYNTCLLEGNVELLYKQANFTVTGGWCASQASDSIKWCS